MKGMKSADEPDLRSPALALTPGVGARCPACKSQLIERKNRKTGQAFIGCRAWPKCHFVYAPAPTTLMTVLAPLYDHLSECGLLGLFPQQSVSWLPHAAFGHATARDRDAYYEDAVPYFRLGSMVNGYIVETKGALLLTQKNTTRSTMSTYVAAAARYSKLDLHFECCGFGPVREAALQRYVVARYKTNGEAQRGHMHWINKMATKTPGWFGGELANTLVATSGVNALTEWDWDD